MADIYEKPTLGAMAEALDEMAAPAVTSNRSVRPVPLKTQVCRVAFTIPLRALTGLRWVTWVAAGNTATATWLGIDWLPTAPWWAIAVGWLLLITPPGRMLVTVLRSSCC